MGQIDLIVIMQELKLEGESVVESTALFLQGVLEITYVLAVTVPANTLTVILISFLFWIYQRFHTLVVGTFWLHQVYEIEFVRNSFSNILNPEVIPLSVNGSVVIVFQNHVILVFTDLDSSSQIARLKSTFEYQCIVIIAILHSVSLKFWVISIDLRHLLIECRLSWWTIGVVLSLIDRVFIGRQLNQVVFINVRSWVSLSFLRGPVDAIIHDSFTLRLVTVHFFCFLSSKFIAHRGIELVDRLKVLAHIFEPGPVSHERLLDTCAW